MSNKRNEDTLKKFVEESENVDAKNHILEPKLSLQNNIGWHSIKLNDLPSRGMFYADGTEIIIKAALGKEIRHWSTLNEEDIYAMDDMLNYILERCCSVKIPNIINSSWKDIVEIDRFYIILAIRELTFLSDNPLTVPIEDGKTRPVTKDMIEYVKFDEKLLKRYDSETKSFKLSLPKYNIEEYVIMPTLGVSSWIKQHMIKAQQQNKSLDMDIISFIPFLIDNWRYLNDKSFNDLIAEANGWSVEKISLLTSVKDKILANINPEIVYMDSHGSEVRVPINFCGGFKSLFIISDIFDELL